MLTKRIMCTRLLFMGVICILIIVSIPLRNAAATDEYDLNDYTISAYSASYFTVTLSEGDGMAGWFRINDGDGIHFFIVDEFGHNEVQSSGSATTAYKIMNCPQNQGNWYYWNFIAPDADTWYIYFSNAFGTSYAGVADELDILIRSDTEAPWLQTFTSLPNSVSRDVTLDFKCVDDCFPVEKVEFYVDGSLIDTRTNPNLETGYVFEESFIWHTFNWVNGNHTIYLRSYDTLGKMSDLLGMKEIEVANGWFDYPINEALTVIGGVALVFVIVALYSKLKE